MALRADDIDLNRDRQLVEAWQAGQKDAFDELYRLYFDRVRAFCERRVGNRNEAEELAQEAFAKALKALPRLSGERRFYPWMTVIASRLCVDHHRRRARVQPSDEVDPGSVDDGHDERIGLQVDLEHLDIAMRRLGPRHVEVLDLRERKGMSYQDIAGHLGVPHSTVETLLFRARRALRREFQLVSADRLAAIPGIGWLALRFDRLRHRIAASGIDFGALGAPIAAGAMSALMALPTGGAAPATVIAASPRTAAPIVATAPVPEPVADLPPADTTGTTTPASPAAAPIVRPMTDAQAKNEVAQMPVQLSLDQLGAGLDPTPVLDRLPGRTLP